MSDETTADLTENIPPEDVELLARDPDRDSVLGDPTASPIERVRYFIAEALNRAGFEVEVAGEERDGNIYIDVSGDDASSLVSQPNGVDSPVVLDALAALCRRVAFPGDTDSRPIVVDADDYRSRRTEQLGELGEYLAEKVADESRELSIYGMNSVDRRAVHRSLAEQDGVNTQSAGNGLFRRLTVRGR